MFNQDEMPGRVERFLAAHEPSARNVECTGYEVMTGGYSRLLAKASVDWTVNGVRRSDMFVLRGDPPVDKQLIVTDRKQEFDILRTVAAAVPTSTARYIDITGEHLGTPALVIDYLPAHSLLPYMAAHDDNALLARPLAEAAAAFHNIPLDHLPGHLERPASWHQYIGQRTDEWRRTALAHVEDLPIMRYVGAWLDAHRPAPVALTLIHGDFQSANLMIGDDGRIAVLDWELAQIGDPREDLGYFKAVAQAAPPDLTALDEAGFCSRYRELTGMNEEQLNPAVIAYFLVLGVVGTVRRLAEGGAAYARGENTLLTSVFSMNSLMFGQMMWIQATEQLEAVFAMVEGTN